MAKSYIGIIKHFNAAPKNVRDYFPEFVALVKNHGWEASVSYVFSRIEQAKRMTIYCGITKLHWTDSVLTKNFVSRDYLSRSRFYDLFKIVFEKEIPKPLQDMLESAEDVRDKIAHGMSWTEVEVRQAMTDVISFATAFNAYLKQCGGFEPFGDLRGYKGRKECLSKATTRWVLRGMGIPK